MEKLQNELRNFIAQYNFLQKVHPYSVIMMAIFPLYKIVNLFHFDFMSSLWSFYTAFIALYIVGMIFAFADNKIKEIVLANVVLFIVTIVEIFNGNNGSFLNLIIYGAITYFGYKNMPAVNISINNTNNSGLNNSLNNINSGAINNDNIQSTNENININENVSTNENTNTNINTPNINNIKNAVTNIDIPKPVINNVSIDISKLWKPIIGAIVLIFSLLQDWFKFDIYYFSGSYSVADIKDFVSKISQLADGFGMSSSEITYLSAFANILYYGMYLIIILEIAFIILKIIDNHKFRACAIAGGVLSIILFLVIMCCVVAIKYSLKDYDYLDAMDNIVSFTIFPFLTVIASVWQLFVFDDRKKNYTSDYTSETVLSEKMKLCPKCGNFNNIYNDVCYYCYSNLENSTFVKLCPECGQYNYMNVEKCNNCGHNYNDTEKIVDKTNYSENEQENKANYSDDKQVDNHTNIELKENICQKCGTKNREYANFCIGCGEKLEK